MNVCSSHQRLYDSVKRKPAFICCVYHKVRWQRARLFVQVTLISQCKVKARIIDRVAYCLLALASCNYMNYFWVSTKYPNIKQNCLLKKEKEHLSQHSDVALPIFEKSSIHIVQMLQCEINLLFYSCINLE